MEVQKTNGGFKRTLALMAVGAGALFLICASTAALIVL